MSVLVVGLSHRTAPMPVLERATLTTAAARDLELELCRGEFVAEAVVLSTCNRLEVYAEVSKFHGGVAGIGTALATATGLPLEELSDHLYVHYEDAAVRHLFTVVSGLDSMAVGEAQVLGQVRAALRDAQKNGAAGRSVGHLMQNALRVGKRAHSETRLDRAAPSLVEAGLERASMVLGDAAGAPAAPRALVIGAGAMSGLAATTAQRAGVAEIIVCSRTEARARRVAEGVGGTALPMAQLDVALQAADVVITCAGAGGYLVDAGAAAAAQRARGGRAQVYVDLALPRDVDPAVAELDAVTLVDLEVLGRDLATRGLDEDLADVRVLIDQEVAAYLAAQRAEAVAPTVVALRAHARSVVEAELARLESRLEDVDERVRAELARTLHRVVEKLLHTPTVRMKELAAEPGGSSYAEALRALFGLGTVPPDGVLPPESVPPLPADPMPAQGRSGGGRR